MAWPESSSRTSSGPVQDVPSRCRQAVADARWSSESGPVRSIARPRRCHDVGLPPTRRLPIGVRRPLETRRPGCSARRARAWAAVCRSRPARRTSSRLSRRGCSGCSRSPIWPLSRSTCLVPDKVRVAVSGRSVRQALEPHQKEPDRYPEPGYAWHSQARKEGRPERPPAHAFRRLSAFRSIVSRSPRGGPH